VSKKTTNLKKKAVQYYHEHYAQYKLPANKVTALKDVIFAALSSDGDVKKLVNKWAARKGVTLSSSDVTRTEPTLLDKKSLKEVLTVLNDANVPNTTYEKSESKEELAQRATAALSNLPSPKLIQKLGSIDPEKLKMLQGDGACLGLFVDLKQPECQVCTDKTACVSAYITNLNDNLSSFKDALINLKTDVHASEVSGEDMKKIKEKSKEKKVKHVSKRLAYNAETAVYVMDIANPLKASKEPEAHAVIASVLKRVPTTLGEIRSLLEKQHQLVYDSDREFMEEMIEQLRDYGVVLLWTDLTKTQRQQYKKDYSSDDEDDDE